MNHFRNLANLGATVLILHHTGKSDGAKDYRGSLDIKGAAAWTFNAAGDHETDGVVVVKLILKPFNLKTDCG
jgi:hypothetical protein